MSEAAKWDDGPEPLPYVPSLLDASTAPDDVAAWAASVTPGSAVGKPLAVLDPARLSPEARVDALVAMEKQISWWQARQHRLIAVMGAQPVIPGPLGELDKEWVKEDISCALKLSAHTAADRLRQAKELSRLPGALDLLETGLISGHHARCLAEATLGLDDATATAIETTVLGKAAGQSLTNFRRAIRKAVLGAAPKTAEQRHEQGMAERRVVCTPAGDGMSQIWMLLPDAGAATVMGAIDALARRVISGDPRTADQRRADAIIKMAIDSLHGTRSDLLPREHGMRPTVNVSVALSTLLDLDEQPGDLAGTGPIPAAVARRIAADETGTWRRIVTDERGQLIDYGRSTYRPPKDLTDHVIARDQTCRFRHCNRQACRCELDHQEAWEAGGRTNETNLLALCSRHHHGKHDAGWTPKRLPDGTIEWTSPTGHRYVEEPATYPIDHTTHPPAQAEPEQTEADPDPPSAEPDQAPADLDLPPF